MKRILAFALPIVLAVPSLARAQMNYSRGSSEQNAGTLLRSDHQRYQGNLRREAPATAPLTRGAMYRGHTPQYILADTLSSDEYYAAAGGSVPTYIRQLYIDVVGRTPLPAEINYWAGRLEHDTRMDITYQMLRHHPQKASILANPPPPYSPGYFPDPTSPTFRDPSGPYFHSPYFYNYEKSRPIRAFPLHARG